MALHPDDWSVDFATGNIRFEGNNDAAATDTPLELHRYLQALADDAQAAGGSNDDILDISSLTPSERITGDIINLLDYTAVGGPRYNVDAASVEHLYGGSVQQGSAETEELFSGLEIVGSVNSTGTQIQVIRDKALIDGDAPFWGDQTTPFNGGGNTLCRFLVQSRIAGCDIDNKKVIVQIHHYGDTYAFFEVTLGTGEKTAAVASTPDPQNKTSQGAVTAYTHVTNTEGFQTIDIGDGNGVQPYYSKWTYGIDTSNDGLKGVWEFIKDLIYTGTAKTIHGIDGELFRGITHSYVYDNLSGTFTEDEEVVWGTGVTYDTLAGGTFTEGYYVRIGPSGAAGRVMYDSGTTFMKVALEDTLVTLLDTEVITEYNPVTGVATGVTAAVDTTTPVADNDKEGGLGLLLASDTTGLKHHVQVRTGVAPVDNLEVRGLSSGATADVDTTITQQTVAPVFLGSYVGSLIGAFGIGIDTDDLAFPDTVTDLDGDINSAPNNVTFTLNGVEAGEDRILIGPKDTGDDFAWDQMATNGALTTAVTNFVVVAIPDNTPQTGNLRITADDGRRLRVPYTSHNGTTTFTGPSFDFSGDQVCASGNDAMCAYIDKEAVADPETYTTIYDSAQNLWVRVRDGGVTPIKTYEAASALSSSGGNATASRISDA